MINMFKTAFEMYDGYGKELEDYGFEKIDLEKIGYDARGGCVLYNEESDILLFTNPQSADYYLGIEYTSRDFRFEIKSPEFNWLWFDEASTSEEERIRELIAAINSNKDAKKDE